jgi:serine/threonine protein kinase
VSASPSPKRPAPSANLPDGILLDRYRIARRISSGGFSTVYLAQDAEGQPVAIKEYMPSTLAYRPEGSLSPRIPAQSLRSYQMGLRSFFEEGRTLALINHPNIVRVLNFFRANDTVYMVMQYESGLSLQEHVLRNRNTDRPGVLSEGFIRRVFAEVLDGLREVHSNRLLHLDIKPANIYLRMDGTPILLDFGAARQTLQRDTKGLVPMYTPGFAAPELYNRDAELGAWTDVYGVGACMYACMAARPPQESPQRLKGDHLPVLLAKLQGVYSQELIGLVERCLRLNSLERPQDISQVQRALLNVPVQHKPTLGEVAAIQLRALRQRVQLFVQKHEITWF